MATAVIAVDSAGHVERWSFERMTRDAHGLAASLADTGLQAGDRVLILMPRVAEWQVAMLACLHLGLVPVPCVTQVSAEEVGYRIARSGSVAAITDRRFLDRFGPARDRLRVRFSRGGGDGWQDLEAATKNVGPPPPPAQMPADAPALMYFTSGSSGPPKAVLHAARGLYVRSRQPWTQLGITEGDVIWTTSDTGWTRAASCLLFGAWMNGATAVMHDGASDAVTKLDALERFGVTCFGAVATELRIIMAQAAPRALPALRFTLSAGEAMTAELADRWRAFSGAPLLVGYGQTETPTATLTSPDAEPLNGMIGRAMEGNHVTVVDDDGVGAVGTHQGSVELPAEGLKRRDRVRKLPQSERFDRDSLGPQRFYDPAIVEIPAGDQRAPAVAHEDDPHRASQDSAYEAQASSSSQILISEREILRAAAPSARRSSPVRKTARFSTLGVRDEKKGSPFRSASHSARHTSPRHLLSSEMSTE